MKKGQPTMASIHRGLLRLLSVVPVWNFAELESVQRATLLTASRPPQLYNPSLVLECFEDLVVLSFVTISPIAICSSH